MNATETSFQVVNGEYVEWAANGAVPALKWTDSSGNKWRAMASYQFDLANEIYTIVVSKFLQLGGIGDWMPVPGYVITADYTKTRILNTGALVLGDNRGDYDASSNLFPETGGSGDLGAIRLGDYWTISVGGTLNGTPVVPGDKVYALVNNPGQVGANWSFTYPSALNSTGSVINPVGWLPNSKFFTIMIGYNSFGQIVSINYWVYVEIAAYEGLTIV